MLYRYTVKTDITFFASASLHTQDTQIGLGALVWQPQATRLTARPAIRFIIFPRSRRLRYNGSLLQMVPSFTHLDCRLDKSSWPVVPLIHRLFNFNRVGLNVCAFFDWQVLHCPSPGWYRLPNDCGRDVFLNMKGLLPRTVKLRQKERWKRPVSYLN